MKHFLITFDTIEWAQRCERVFSEAGVCCRMRRVPKWMADRGNCFGIEAKFAAPEEGLDLLRRAKIPFCRCCALHSDGITEAVAGNPAG